MDEITLAKRCANGDEGAWQTLLEKYSGYILTSVTKTLCRHGFHDHMDEADDIFSEVILSLIDNGGRKMASYEGKNGSRLSTYLWVVASRVTIDCLRKKSRTLKTEVSSDDPAKEPADPHELPDAAMEKSEMEHIRRELLAALDGNDRRFVYLYYELGLSVEEIARRLDITASAVYSKKNRIKSRFAKIYCKKFPEHASHMLNDNNHN